MKKLATHYLLWSIGLAASYLLALVIIAKIPAINGLSLNVKNTTGGYGHSLLRFNEADHIDEVDLLFLGSFHTYRGFDPRIFAQFGLSSFNLGSSAQTPMNTYYLLEKYIDEIDVELLVFDTYWVIASNPDGKEATIDLASNMPITNINFKMAWQSKNIEVMNSVLASWVAQKINPNQLDISGQQDIHQNEYVPGGFVESTRSIDIDGAIKNLKPKTASFIPLQLKFVDKIAKLAQEKQVGIIFVRVPVSQEFYDGVVNYSETISAYQDIADKYEIDFIDFNTPDHRQNMSITTESDFYDLSHLNQSGVEKFNKYLAPFLIKSLAELAND